MSVAIHNYTNTGANGIPDDVPETQIYFDIQIVDKAGKVLSAAANAPVSVTGGPSSKEKQATVVFDRNLGSISQAEHDVVIKVSPAEVTTGADPDSRVYQLSAKAWVVENNVISIYLEWDNGKHSEPEIIRIYALPEDEIGAYKILDDGTKEYLIFHTYDICMRWLGSDELCRGYERCFHKENAYVNPFVTDTGVIGEIVN